MMRVACLVASNAQTRTANCLLLNAIIIGTGVDEVIPTPRAFTAWTDALAFSGGGFSGIVASNGATPTGPNPAHF
ncbi:hypothetical protein B1A87_019975 [Arthrobacter sp. KBS0703]|uniref:hypothetical protein n=1 Tax=Bacteria TaxID=2 RepID=UPI001117040F|nr:hypothetical protein [Arthrobacter sp. KBS0703]TSE17717.1 hypothetical protein B1A87_019975 [Arthrobacter sp. KBS0703]